MVRWLAVLAVAVAACGGDRRAPSSGRDAAPAAPRAAVTVDACRVAWRPTADAIALPPAPAPAPKPVKGKKPPGPPRPRVVFLPPVVVGSMGKELVRRSVKKSAAGLEACYREAIGRSPALAGQVTAIFTIDPTGAVIQAHVVGPDDRLDGCLAGAIRAIRFPASQSGGGVQVRYPLDLHVESAPPPDEDDEVEESAVDAGVASPASVLRDLAWADEDADPAVERWATDQLAPVVRAASADLEACGLGDLTGSLRAQLAVGADGAILGVEVGGLGAAAAEDCVRERLARLVAPPPPLPVAAACDVTAHAARPWRITVRPGQSVIDVGTGAGMPEPTAGTSPIIVRVDPAVSAVAVQQVTARLARLRSPYLLGVLDGDDLVLISDMVPRGAGPSPATPRPRTHLALAGNPSVIAARAVCTDCDHVAEIEPGAGDAAALRALAIALHDAGVERIVLAEPSP